MPVLSIQTNVSLEEETLQEAQEKLSRLTATWLGKQESYVMAILDTGKRMSFAGTDEPCAYCELESLGLSEGAMPELAQKICEELDARLGIPQERIYIKFQAPPRSHFAWNGKTFG